MSRRTTALLALLLLAPLAVAMGTLPAQASSKHTSTVTVKDAHHDVEYLDRTTHKHHATAPIDLYRVRATAHRAGAHPSLTVVIRVKHARKSTANHTERYAVRFLTMPGSRLSGWTGVKAPKLRVDGDRVACKAAAMSFTATKVRFTVPLSCLRKAGITSSTLKVNSELDTGWGEIFKYDHTRPTRELSFAR